MFRRILAAAFLVALAIVLLIFAWPQLFGLQDLGVIAQVVALRGLAIVVAVIGVVAFALIAVVSSVARRFAASIALLLLLFSGLNLAVLATRGFGNLAFETIGPNDLTVLEWNTLGDAPGAKVIAALAIETGADVLALPETTEKTGQAVAAAMAKAGRPMHVWTIAYDQISKARSTTLLISTELGEYDVDLTTPTTAVLPSLVAKPADGTGPTIVAVHDVAPLPDELTNWRKDLRWLESACAGTNVILAGDFNSTIDHYAGLASSAGNTIGECSDAAMLSRNAAVGTWPTSLPALLGAPIDHLMVTDNWQVSGMRVIENYDKYGSDHRPILVQLSPTH
jgi:endonuclease/exonuclease/phosphatase (EEP) superfamily protein YafD